MNCEEIIFFETLGFGWAVNKGMVEKVFPEAGRGRKRGRKGMTVNGMERRKSIRR
jgi:hypothetical protein